MFGLSSIGLEIALAALGVLVLGLAFKLRARPAKAEKWEKAAIMKQLLALSEAEANLRTKAPVRLQPSAAKRAVPPARKAPLKMAAKAGVAGGSKVRAK